MLKTRIRARDLVSGDIVPQTLRVKIEGQPAEISRTVVIGKVEPLMISYNGFGHEVTHVRGLDPETSKVIMWVSVPDQPTEVIR